MSVDEHNGRAYHNLKILAQVGKSAYKELGEPDHARLYNLNALNLRDGALDPADEEQDPTQPGSTPPDTKPGASNPSLTPPVPSPNPTA